MQTARCTRACAGRLVLTDRPDFRRLPRLSNICVDDVRSASKRRSHLAISARFSCGSLLVLPIERERTLLPPATSGAASKGLPRMFTTRTIATRTLIWLAAISVPVQGLPAAPCGCIGSKACSQSKESSGSCCSTNKARGGQRCCAGPQENAGHSCCSAGEKSGCQCGINCQCGATQNQAPAPPPVEQSQTEKVLNDAFATVSIATVGHSRTTQHHGNTAADANASAALDRCVSLCRFTL